ncbi:MAG: hypothetical protein GAK37_02707 [Pseudomonas sp.]|nr:MAG: hypothetical protein GAK37_02707 [Pseudomonas sp.]
MQRVIHSHADQAGAQYQRHHVHMTEQRHTGHRAKQHAHQHRHKRQQHTHTAKGQQQQQQDARCGAAAHPSDFPGGLLLSVGGVQQTAGSEQLHALLAGLFAAGLEQIGDLHRQVHVERIAGGACPQQYPAFAVGIGDQRATADVQLHRAVLRLAGLDATREAQPIVLARHQAETGKGVEQGLHPLLDKGFGLLGQLLAVFGLEHRQAPAQQLVTQGGKVGLQVPLHGFEQAAGLPALGQLAGHVQRLLALGMPHQHQHFAVQRFLHALFGAQFQRVGCSAGHQCHQVGGQRRAMAPLPGGQRQHGHQQRQEQARQQAFTAQSRVAPRR